MKKETVTVQPKRTTSIYANTKALNILKKMKKEVIVYELRELVNTYSNHYAYKITDRFVSTAIFKKNCTVKKDLTSEIYEHYRKTYPFLTDSDINSIIGNYILKNNRKISRHIIKRSYALLVVHMRHEDPDYIYDSTNHAEVKRMCNQKAHRKIKDLLNLHKKLTTNDTVALQGISETYYLNRQLSSQSTYKYGILHGPHKTWHPNGKLERHCNYKNGKLHGELKAFRDDGQLWEHSNFTNGLQDGESMWWNTDNILSLQRFFKKGLLDGVCKLRENKGLLTNRNFWRKGDHFGQQTIFKNC